MHGIGQQCHAAAGDIDDNLQRGGQAEGEKGDPDRADGQLVIQEGAVASQVVVAVVMREAGQVEGGGDAREGAGGVVMVMVMVMVVRVCHGRGSWWLGDGLV